MDFIWILKTIVSIQCILRNEVKSMFEIISFKEIDILKVEDKECYVIDFENEVVFDITNLAISELQPYLDDKECIFIRRIEIERD